jgi:hypothetical protein
MSPQVSWLFFKARATSGKEPDLQERKMVRDAPSSRLADGPF